MLLAFIFYFILILFNHNNFFNILKNYLYFAINDINTLNVAHEFFYFFYKNILYLIK